MYTGGVTMSDLDQKIQCQLLVLQGMSLLHDRQGGEMNGLNLVDREY